MSLSVTVTLSHSAEVMLEVFRKLYVKQHLARKYHNSMIIMYEKNKKEHDKVLSIHTHTQLPRSPRLSSMRGKIKTLMLSLVCALKFSKMI